MSGTFDLTGLEPGDDVEVYYISQRSGNEVSREGTVVDVFESNEGPVVQVRTGDGGSFGKHHYTALVEGETKNGDDCIIAVSVTTEADGMIVSDAPADEPTIGARYKLEHEITRRETLGVVKRAVRGPRGHLGTRTTLEATDD